MSFDDSVEIVTDRRFRQRLRLGMTKVALAIIGETVDVGLEARAGKRHALAELILTPEQVERQIERFAWATVTNPVITKDSPDNDLEFQISAVFDDLAGVTGAEAA
jgi:hypothetical protein